MEIQLKPDKRDEFEARVRELGPWMHHFKFGESCFTGIYPVEGMVREETYCTGASDPETIARFRRAYSLMDHEAKRRFFKDLLAGIEIDRGNATVLDIASATGKYSLWAVEEGFGRVLSSEIRPNQCDQQRLILASAQDRTFADHIVVANDMVSADRREYQDLYADKGVDVVLSLGLLYHVSNPLQHIINCAAIARKCAVIYTRTRISAYNVDAWALKREDPDWVTLAIEGVSWVPHFHYLVQNYKKLGFRSCRIAYPDVFSERFSDFATFGRRQMAKINMADRLSRWFNVDIGYRRNLFRHCRHYAGLDGHFFAYVLEK